MDEREATPYLVPLNPVFSGFKGDLVTVTADGPLPPGSRVRFFLALIKGKTTVDLVGKIASALPLEQGRFCLTVRLHSLSREQRSALIAENAE